MAKMPAAANPQQKRSTVRKRTRLLRVCGLIALIVLAFLILSIKLLPEQVSLSEGEIASEDVFYSGTTTTFVSAIQTELLKNEAAAAVGQIFNIDEEVTQGVLSSLDQFAQRVGNAATLAAVEDADLEKIYSELRANLPGDYADELLADMLNLERASLTSYFNQFKTIIESTYRAGVKEDEIEAVRQGLALSISASNISGSAETFFKSMLAAMELPVNEIYDAVATRARQDEAMEEVSAVVVKVLSGQKIISRGALITAEQIETLQALGMHTEKSNYTVYIGLLAVLALLFVLLFWFLRFYKKKIYSSLSSLLMLGIILILFLTLCKLLSLIEVNPNPDIAMLIGFLLPVPAAAMLIAVLLDQDTAIVSTVVLAVCVGVIMEGRIVFALLALSGGITAVLTTVRMNQRSQFVGASAWIILANLVLIGGWGLLWSESYQIILVGMLFGLINGLLSAILAMGVLPFLEGLFGVTTSIRLLELSNSNNLLLKKLMVEAPGTYNHSILVGNLAEAAADAIDANSLLVRVASYYHDIGKLKRPHFYIENQRIGENPHDKLQPAVSAMIITSHPVDGGKILREARFPQEITDIVEQHHGNSLLSYFYHKAKELSDTPELINEADFRYKGQKPQTREAALVMLADSVQAAVQALSADNRDTMEQRVREVIDGKLHGDDQLSDCPLTLRELEQITQSFLTVLSGMHHIRINYPGAESALDLALKDPTKE